MIPFAPRVATRGARAPLAAPVRPRRRLVAAHRSAGPARPASLILGLTALILLAALCLGLLATA